MGRMIEALCFASESLVQQMVVGHLEMRHWSTMWTRAALAVPSRCLPRLRRWLLPMVKGGVDGAEVVARSILWSIPSRKVVDVAFSGTLRRR